jgi:hypothetical protein
MDKRHTFELARVGSEEASHTSGVCPACGMLPAVHALSAWNEHVAETPLLESRLMASVHVASLGKRRDPHVPSTSLAKGPHSPNSAPYTNPAAVAETTRVNTV